MNPKCALFHSDSWNHLVELSLGYESAEVAVNCGGSTFVLRCWEKRFLAFRLVGSPLRGGFIPCSPLQSTLTNTELNEVLRVLFLRSRAGFSEITFDRLIPNNPCLLLRLIYKKFNKYTFVIDLSPSIDQIFMDMSQRARNMIRKAEKNRVRVEEISNPSEREIVQFYAMLEATFAKSKTKPPHKMSFFSALFKSKLSYVLYKACYGNEVCGYSLFVFDNEEAFYLAGTSTRVGNKYAASSLIQWSAIQRFKDYGISLYDLGGGGIPSIDKFKQSFGGKIVFRTSFLSRLSFGYLALRLRELIR